MTKTRNLLSLCLISIFLTAGCGGDNGTAPLLTGGGGGPPKANPDGVLLPGDPANDAVTATRLLPPSPVEQTDIIDGLLTTRLIGMLDPAATVAEVNQVLEANNVRIVAMSKNSLMHTLKVPRVNSEAEAKALAATLQATGAFVHVQPAREATTLSRTSDELQRVLPPSGEAGAEHLLAMHFPAAWNAARLTFNTPNVTVAVFDGFNPTVPPEVSHMTFFQGNGYATATNNHGYEVAGVIGAKFDGAGPTGTHPRADTKLEIIGLVHGGLSWLDMLIEASVYLPSSGFFVLNTSLGYNDPTFESYSMVDRVIWALEWRKLIGEEWGRFVHATAAGNDGTTAGAGGDALWGSPFTTAIRHGDLTTAIPPDSLDGADSARVAVAWENAQNFHPYALAAQPNGIIVGSTDYDGAESTFSSRGADVYAVGEAVTAPCSVADGQCDGSVASPNGTSFASPQIAGLAAYIRSLDPTKSPSDILQIINDAAFNSSGLIVNAYLAVQFIDETLNDPKIRKELLDVAGGTPLSPPNGVFDEVDIEAFLDVFESNELSPAPPADYSRYDLNGDGWSGTDKVGPFDLDVALPHELEFFFKTIEGQNISFDENSVTDRDVLCYYAYSNLYSGDEEERKELLADCLGLMDVTFDFDGRLDPDEFVGVTITVKTPEGDPVVGADITTFTSQGDMSNPSSGVTDGSGKFSTSVKVYAWQNEAVVRAFITPQGEDEYRTEGSQIRKNEVELQSRRSQPRALGQFSISTPNYSSIFSEQDNDDVQTFELLDKSYEVNETGSSNGMTGKAHPQLDHRSEVTLSGDNFTGATHNATATVFGSLENPPGGEFLYALSSRGTSSLSVDFAVWGDPGTISFTLDQSEMSRVDFDGPPGFDYCWQGNAVCPPPEDDLRIQLIELPNGLLRVTLNRDAPPGRYRMVSTMNANVTFSSDEEQPNAGFSTVQGHVDLTLTVSQ